MDLKPAALKRYKDVARLLVKYGGPAMRESAAALAGGVETTDDPETTARGEELARDLEALGPTFIKLGQLLSSRTTLLPAAYSEALERLQDAVEPFPFETVEQIVQDELGVRISKAFEEFDPEPVASASLGQVHQARLRGGREVVVKVQRPDIRGRILEDLDAFDEMARVLERHTTVGDRMELEGVLVEFRKTILEELDYRREAQNLERLAENLAGFDRIVVPRPVPDYSTGRVLTMDYVAGTKITRAGPLALQEVDGEELAEELFRAYLKQVLVDGFFHADPHPGNVFLTPDGRIALLDLGMVARLSSRLRDTLLKLVLAIADGRSDETADYALAIATRRDDADEPTFRRRVTDLVGQYSGTGLVALPVGKVFLEMVRAAVDTGIRLPADTAMLGKTLVHLDAAGRVLAPNFDPTDSIRRNSARLLRDRMLKSLAPGNVVTSALELRDFVDRLPSRVNKILDAAAGNELGLKIDTGIDATQLMVGFQKVANRIAMGLVLAALIVGAALLMRVETSFRIFGYPGFAILLFLVAAAAGAALVIQIAANDLRAGRGRPGARDRR
jgi:predicted unusual protein kinase regulating ubiquinone biosynthesis (AarF/ABC1/UbiB family)